MYVLLVCVDYLCIAHVGHIRFLINLLIIISNKFVIICNLTSENAESEWLEPSIPIYDYRYVHTVFRLISHFYFFYF